MTEKKLRTMMIALAWILPIWSILLAVSMPLTHFNLSYIGNSLHKRFGFIGWGVLSGSYFYLSFHYFLKRLHISDRGLQLGILISCIMMPLSTIVPYLPKRYPLLSNIHLVMAIGGTAGYILLFLGLLLKTIRTDILLFQKAFQSYCFICIGCALPILMLASVTSLSEVMFTTFMPLYHQYLIKLMKDSSLIDY